MDKKIEKMQNKIEELEELIKINKDEIRIYTRGIEITEIELKKMKATKRYRVLTQVFDDNLNQEEKVLYNLSGRTYKDCEGILKGFKAKVNSLDRIIDSYGSQINSKKKSITKREEKLNQ